MKEHHVAHAFTRVAKATARTSGRPAVFGLAVLVIVVWAISGPLFGFSDTWQLVINTGTSITTFLMVFLIQNTQNRDTEALQLKLDELIRALDGAHNAMMALEELQDDQLDAIRKRYARLAEAARKHLGEDLREIDEAPGRNSGLRPGPCRRR